MQGSTLGQIKVEWMCFCGHERVVAGIVVGCDDDNLTVVCIDYICKECFL